MNSPLAPTASPAAENRKANPNGSSSRRRDRKVARDSRKKLKQLLRLKKLKRFLKKLLKNKIFNTDKYLGYVMEVIE